MREKPILFSGPMVKAILEGRKTQTRRIVKFPKWMHSDEIVHAIEAMNLSSTKSIVKRGICDGISDEWNCPYGAVGDKLWVRETHFLTYLNHWPDLNPTIHDSNIMGNESVYNKYCFHKAGFNRSTGGIRWRPSIHMPRWASRITLEVTDVRVERLQDISERDAINEGMPSKNQAMKMAADAGLDWYNTPTAWFKRLWNSINAERAPWESNPWVWVIEFEVAK